METPPVLLHYLLLRGNTMTCVYQQRRQGLPAANNWILIEQCLGCCPQSVKADGVLELDNRTVDHLQQQGAGIYSRQLQGRKPSGPNIGIWARLESDTTYPSLRVLRCRPSPSSTGRVCNVSVKPGKVELLVKPS